MSKEWSEEGLNFDAKVPIKNLSELGIQRVIEESKNLNHENQEADDDD